MIMSTLSGRYQVKVFDRFGKIRLITPWFDNLVTDVGLNRIGLGSFLTHCSVGTGNTSPTASDTALVSLIGTTTTIISQAPGANSVEPYYGTRIITYSFLVGEATGNLAEVGVGWDSGLFSRALMVDGNGDPTVITVLADESIAITYELRNYVPVNDVNFTADVDGITRNCVARAAYATSGSTTLGWGITGDVVSAHIVDAYNGTLGVITSAPSGVMSSVTGSTAVYVNNSNEIGMSSIWALAQGNLVNGMSAFLLRTNGLGCYQFSVDPPINKLSTNILSMAFKVLWSRP